MEFSFHYENIFITLTTLSTLIEKKNQQL